MLKHKQSFKPKLSKKMSFNKGNKKKMETKSSKKKRTLPTRGIKLRRLKEGHKKGAVCVRNLPFGFYEEGVSNFFGQFGEISRCKVARSNKNANPMGFAYIEFEHYQVAKIVANTMNNYLMFKKLIKCRYIPFKQIKDKMFSNSNLCPELCSGTKRKLKNQYKMAHLGEETLKAKLKKKLCSSLAQMSKAIGKKIEEDPELLAFKDEQSEAGSVQNDLVEQIQEVSLDNEDTWKVSEETSLIRSPKSRKKKRLSETTKGNFENHGEPNDEENSKTSKNNELNTAKISNRKRKLPISDDDDAPIIMEIDEVDEEIYFKTPPNVIKIIKRGEQRIICDEVATTVKKPVKKLNLGKLDNVTNKLFDKIENPISLSEKKSPKLRKRNKLSQSKLTADSGKMNLSNLKPSVTKSKGKSKIKVQSLSKNNERPQNGIIHKGIKPKPKSTAKPLQIKKKKSKKGQGIDLTASLTNERCINVSERKASIESSNKKRKHSNKKSM